MMPNRCQRSEGGDGDTYAGCIREPLHDGRCDVRPRPEDHRLPDINVDVPMPPVKPPKEPKPEPPQGVVGIDAEKFNEAAVLVAHVANVVIDTILDINVRGLTITLPGVGQTLNREVKIEITKEKDDGQNSER